MKREKTEDSYDDTNETIKRKRANESCDECVVTTDMSEFFEICSVLCKDAWSKVIEFCDTREWMRLSYTCKGLNQFKFNPLLLFNKRMTLKCDMESKEIEHWWRLRSNTLFNVDLNGNPYVNDEHFQFFTARLHTLSMNFCQQVTNKAFSYLTGIHTLEMIYCHQITDQAFSHLGGIHTLDMSYCSRITDNSFRYLTAIHTLIIANCKQITDNAFVHLTGIHTLDVSGCDSITDNAFSYLTGVHTLDIRSCLQITDNAFPHFVGIHALDMSGCYQESITEKALVFLKDIRRLCWCNRRNHNLTDKVRRHCKRHSITLKLKEW